LCALSPDFGDTWNAPTPISNLTTTDAASKIVTFKASTGRLILVNSQSNSSVYLFQISDDNGSSWSEPAVFPVSFMDIPSLSESPDGTLWLLYPTSYSFMRHINVIKSNDYGNSWSSGETIISRESGFLFNPSLVFLNSTEFYLTYLLVSSNFKDYYIDYAVSTNGGAAWEIMDHIIPLSTEISSPQTIVDENDKMHIIYQKKESTIFPLIYQEEIYYVSKPVSSGQWSEPQKFTSYLGNDFGHRLASSEILPVISFVSNRSGNNQPYFGIFGVSSDSSAPPALYKDSYFPENPALEEGLSFIVFADDDNGIGEAAVNIFHYDSLQFSVSLHDDGAHQDSSEGDGIYGAYIKNIPYSDLIMYNISLTDSSGNTFESGKKPFLIPSPYGDNRTLFDINRIKMPLNNYGVLADILLDGESGGRYDGISFIFSGGFYMAGQIDGEIWATGNLSADRVIDYQAGPAGSNQHDLRNTVYIVKNSDQPFGKSWQDWKTAVELGANFYDGNNDNIYDPVDLNGNGLWDPNEDRPDLIGDMTAWTVFHDGVPRELRRFNDMDPLGIEIKQTIFAAKSSSQPDYENMIFIRYEIENTGLISDKLDSVFFAFSTDDDIGPEYYTDLTGSDTLLQSSFAYKATEDDTTWGYGNTPPAVFSTVLQGPHAFIPGVTFSDNDLNGIYDEGIDTPLMSANLLRGPHRGSRTIAGAKNLSLSSLMNIMRSHVLSGAPNDRLEVWNYLRGRSKDGNYIDPCTWNWGNGQTLQNCGDINPIFVYSGDPVSGTGWLHTFPSDIRRMTSTGPFRLEKNKPVEIIFALTVGRGSDRLNSISVSRNYVLKSIGAYNSNFTSLPVDIDDEFFESGLDFSLEQNYPNPFNPNTIIGFNLPNKSFVELKVYDILGREVAIILNEEKNAGLNEVLFNASSLSSGVYLYRLRAGNFIQTRKMILLK
jgi:hypothetical protein